MKVSIGFGALIFSILLLFAAGLEVKRRNLDAQAAMVIPNVARIYIVEIDGNKYVVAKSTSGLAICPKTKE